MATPKINDLAYFPSIARHRQTCIKSVVPNSDIVFENEEVPFISVSDSIASSHKSSGYPAIDFIGVNGECLKQWVFATQYDRDIELNYQVVYKRNYTIEGYLSGGGAAVRLGNIFTDLTP